MDAAHRGTSPVQAKDAPGGGEVQDAAAPGISSTGAPLSPVLNAGQQVVQRQEADDEEATREAGEDIPASDRAAIFERLAGSSEFQGYLQRVEAARGDTNFPIKWSTRGGYFSNGSIYINREDELEGWAKTVAHEIVHLVWDAEGNSADVETQSREDFVDTTMTEEIEAQTATYITLLQIGDLTNTTAAGFQDFLAMLQADHAELLENQDWDAIRELAGPFLEDKYRNEWVGSSSGLNYYEKWGAHWDRVRGS